MLGVPSAGLVPHACAVAARGACPLGVGAVAAAIRASRRGTSLAQRHIGVLSVVSDLSSSPRLPEYPSHFPVRPQTREQASLAQPEEVKGLGVVGREGTSLLLWGSAAVLHQPAGDGCRGCGQPRAFSPESPLLGLGSPP